MVMASLVPDIFFVMRNTSGRTGQIFFYSLPLVCGSHDKECY